MDRFFDPYQWTIDLRQEIIDKTQLPISFGLAANKMVAKIATDEAKPNGYLFVQPGKEKDFLAPLPVNKFPGVGEQTFLLLKAMGIHTIRDLSETPVAILEKKLGKTGSDLWKRSQGIHNSQAIELFHQLYRKGQSVRLLGVRLSELTNHAVQGSLFDDAERKNKLYKAIDEEEFAKRNVKVLALSVDPLDKHNGWVNDINETQHVTVGFPIIADEDKSIANAYGMIHPNASETFTVRSLFVIGPDKKIKLTLTYPASTGRNFHEVLRVIDSLQLTANYSVATPADWKEGEDVIVVTSISTADAIQKFPKGVKEVKPYLRYTPQPNK
eukprot:jgi/Mesen1/876/ME001140S10960